MTLPHIVLALDDIDTLGGVQRVVWTLADTLTDLGADVTIVSLHGSGQPAMAHRHDIRVFRLRDSPPGLRYTPRGRFDRFKLRAQGQGRQVASLHRDVAALKEHLLTLIGPTSVVVAMQLQVAEYLVAAQLEAPLVVQYHGAFEAAQAWDLPRLRRLTEHAAELLCLTAGDAEAFERRGLELGHQRNPVEFTPAPDRPRERLVVAAGRFDPEKRHDLLLDAWRMVCAEHPDWRLELYGEGSRRQALVAQADDLPTAHVLPRTDQWAEVLAGASLHALSSRHEGMGLVIAEAMAAGVPSVATDCGAGVRTLITPGRTGLVVPVDDTAALAHALDQLMRDDDARTAMGLRGRSVVSRYAPEVVAHEWLDRAHRVLGATSAGRTAPERTTR